ncbi:MAG: hydroxyacid dehydrogenase [Thiotrichales bacterium]|nr:hydroxyacid dehydrogenase [Thiotrichales bacterium]
MATPAKRRILFIQRVHDRGHALAAERDDIDIDVYEGRDLDEIRRRIADADAIVVRTAVIDRSVIDAGPRLAIISRHGVGYDAVDIAAAAERSIPVTITPLANAVSVAEHAMFLLLSLAKNARENDAAVRTGRFEAARVSMKPLDLAGRKLLVVGFGRTGSRVVPRALGFGMNVYAIDPYVDRTVMEAAGCTVADDLHAVLPEMDAVTVHTPLNHETRGIIGARELALMKPTAFVVNTARGGVVAEDALLAALEAGRIGGAGLDVFESEPTPPRPDHPLLGFDNVIVSPHCAGVTIESSMRMAEYSVRNVLDCFDGRLDPDVVVNRHLMPPPA